jgi:hypothetical protein
VPEAPTGVAATIGQDQAVSLTWTAPVGNGGGAIDYYVVFKDGVDEAHPTSLSTVIAGLNNGQAYRFTVAAHNGAGIGPQSAPVNATPLAVPGVPESLTAVGGNAQVSLSWAAPVSNGGRAIDYYVVYRDGVEVSRAAALSALVANLSNGVQYTFSVAAHNDLGLGLLSASVTIAAATTPSVPRNMAAVSGPGKISLTWEAPASTGGSPVVSYRIYRQVAAGMNVEGSYRAPSESELIANLSGSTFSYVDKNVVAGTTYQYSVIACNAIGMGVNAAFVRSSAQAVTGTDNTMLYIGAGLAVAMAAISAFIVLRGRRRRPKISRDSKGEIGIPSATAHSLNREARPEPGSTMPFGAIPLCPSCGKGSMTLTVFENYDRIHCDLCRTILMREGDNDFQLVRTPNAELIKQCGREELADSKWNKIAKSPRSKYGPK